MGTNNPLVPGNAACLAMFTTAQAGLVSANEAVNVAREALREAYIDRDAAEAEWDDKVTCLCAFTESATEGNPGAIVSAGFGVRAQRTPPQPLGAPQNVTVQTNGSPGVSRLSYRLSGADTFLIERSMDPVTPINWEQVLATTKTSCEIPGGDPGKRCWFRIAGVNAAGQGPWSEPASRPVM
jgi:hypothetical protein